MWVRLILPRRRARSGVSGVCAWVVVHLHGPALRFGGAFFVSMDLQVCVRLCVLVGGSGLPRWWLSWTVNTTTTTTRRHDDDTTTVNHCQRKNQKYQHKLSFIIIIQKRHQKRPNTVTSTQYLENIQKGLTLFTADCHLEVYLFRSIDA